VFAFLAVERETLQNTIKLIEFIESFIYPTEAQLDSSKNVKFTLMSILEEKWMLKI
jgi:hypothetical protein